jgi:hypothetical protein
MRGWMEEPASFNDRPQHICGYTISSLNGSSRSLATGLAVATSGMSSMLECECNPVVETPSSSS